jgi:hypothetical protein
VIEIDDGGGDKKPSAANKIDKPMEADMAQPIEQQAAKKPLAARPLTQGRCPQLNPRYTSREKGSLFGRILENPPLHIGELESSHQEALTNCTQTNTTTTQRQQQA